MPTVTQVPSGYGIAVQQRQRFGDGVGRLPRRADHQRRPEGDGRLAQALQRLFDLRGGVAALHALEHPVGAALDRQVGLAAARIAQQPAELGRDAGDPVTSNQKVTGTW